MPFPGASTASRSGRSAARLARLLREQEVGSSNLPAPTTSFPTQSFDLYLAAFGALLVLCLASPSLARTPLPATYEVRRGDNLSLIAQRFGTTVAALKRDNSLRSDIIHVGDRISLKHPFARRSTRQLSWERPLRHPGPVLRPFGQYKAAGILMPRTGTELAAPVGTQLYAPATGVVRHSGPIEGIGHILIIEHAGDYATVLSPCDPASVRVTVGQAVLRGDPLARTAAPDEAGAKPFIHVELRRKDKAIPPDRMLR